MNWAEKCDICLHICWGAQAALYHHYGIGKFELPKNVQVFIRMLLLINC